MVPKYLWEVGKEKWKEGGGKKKRRRERKKLRPGDITVSHRGSLSLESPLRSDLGRFSPPGA